MKNKTNEREKTTFGARVKTLTLSVLLTGLLSLNLTACTNLNAEELTRDIQASEVSGKAADEEFIRGQMSFALNVFKGSYSKQPESSLLISPLSLMSALAMTANGAGGETLTEMENVLGGIPIEELNEYLYTYLNKFRSDEKNLLNIANSVWFRTGANVDYNQDFLQKTVDYYVSEIYVSEFDEGTVKDVNNWVKSNTDGMIDKIIDVIDDEAIMFIINALAFDGEWKEAYEKNDVIDGIFTDIKGNEQQAEMMCSTEHDYMEDRYAAGFVKSYKGGRYKFAALLPNEGITLEEYIASLTPEGLTETLNNRMNASVNTQLPKFSYEYSALLNDVLEEAGMSKAFGSDADFYGMGTPQEGEWIELSKVLHKTFIDVSEKGTRAAAISFVQMDTNDVAMAETETKTVILDRPFLYMIIDGETNLPVFMGTVTSIS